MKTKEKGKTRVKNKKPVVMTDFKLYMIVSKNEVEKEAFIEKTISKSYSDYSSEHINLDGDMEYVENVFRVKSLVNENKVVFLSYSLKDLSKKFVIKKPRKKTITYEEKLIDIFSSIEKDIIVFLLPDSSDKRKSLQKYVTDGFAYVEFSEPTDDYIKDYIKSYAKQNKCTIEPQALKYIFNNVLKDVSLIKSELDKLFVYSNNITLEIAQSLVVVSSEVAVFDLIDAIASKDFGKTFGLIDSYMSSNDNIFALIALLQRNFRMIYYAGIYGKSFAETLKVNPFIAKKYAERVRLFKERELVKKMMLLVDSEVSLKSGTNYQNAIYDIVLSLLS